MKNTLRLMLLVGMLGALALPSVAHAQNTWTIDGAHSNIGFKVRHMMVSWTRGSFGTSAAVTIDRKDFGLTWSKSLDGGGLVVGDEIHIQLDLELNQVKEGEK